MFSFAYLDNLFFLLAIPVIAALYFLARRSRRQKLEKFGRPEVIADLMPDVSPYKPPLKITLQLLALLFIIIALARPWGGIKDEKTTKEGIEVVIAMDASNSMLASATDDPEGTDRMRTAKLMLERLINRLDNDRVGLIVYAGDAYTLVPVTSDYVSARMFLNSIDPSAVTNQGTNIEAAIDMASRSFGKSDKTGRAMILITDAEDLENPEGVMEAARTAAKNGIQIDVIGVGSPTPVPIPYGNGMLLDPETGERVQTALNEDLATEIAKAGKGIYVNASNSDALSELQKQLDTVKKTALETSFYALHDEIFAIFAWIALALLIADIFLLDRKISWLDKITFFKKEEKK